MLNPIAYGKIVQADRLEFMPTALLKITRLLNGLLPSLKISSRYLKDQWEPMVSRLSLLIRPLVLFMLYFPMETLNFSLLVLPLQQVDSVASSLTSKRRLQSYLLTTTLSTLPYLISTTLLWFLQTNQQSQSKALTLHPSTSPNNRIRSISSPHLHSPLWRLTTPTSMYTLMVLFLISQVLLSQQQVNLVLFNISTISPRQIKPSLPFLTLLLSTLLLVSNISSIRTQERWLTWMKQSFALRVVSIAWKNGSLNNKSWPTIRLFKLQTEEDSEYTTMVKLLRNHQTRLSAWKEVLNALKYTWTHSSPNIKLPCTTILNTESTPMVLSSLQLVLSSQTRVLKDWELILLLPAMRL